MNKETEAQGGGETSLVTQLVNVRISKPRAPVTVTDTFLEDGMPPALRVWVDAGERDAVQLPSNAALGVQDKCAFIGLRRSRTIL